MVVKECDLMVMGEKDYNQKSRIEEIKTLRAAKPKATTTYYTFS